MLDVDRGDDAETGIATGTGVRPARKKYQFTHAMAASPAPITSQSVPLIIVVSVWRIAPAIS
jgi:hypothetical protein